MKTIIATTALLLASVSAHAYDASIDANEYHTGFADSTLVSSHAALAHNQNQEGNFTEFGHELVMPQGELIGNNLDTPDLYVEGNFAI